MNTSLQTINSSILKLNGLGTGSYTGSITITKEETFMAPRYAGKHPLMYETETALAFCKSKGYNKATLKGSIEYNLYRSGVGQTQGVMVYDNAVQGSLNMAYGGLSLFFTLNPPGTAYTVVHVPAKRCTSVGGTTAKLYDENTKTYYRYSTDYDQIREGGYITLYNRTYRNVNIDTVACWAKLEKTAEAYTWPSNNPCYGRDTDPWDCYSGNYVVQPQIKGFENKMKIIDEVYCYNQ